MTSFAGGVGHLARGFGMWRRRPGLMLLGMVPALVVFLLLLAAFLVLLWKVDDLVGWATPFADDWATTARTILRLGLMLAVLSAAIFVSAALFVALTLAVGEPFYERIWRATEQMLGGPVPDHEIGALRSVGDSLAFAVLCVVCGAGVLLVGFLPVVGPVLGTVVGVAVSGRLLASELVARPLEARGLDRAARKELLRRHPGGLLGFGIATQLCFLVPFGAILVMPAAVVGSTGLARDLLADPAQTLAQPR
jgi:CysZ protein